MKELVFLLLVIGLGEACTVDGTGLSVNREPEDDGDDDPGRTGGRPGMGMGGAGTGGAGGRSGQGGTNSGGAGGSTTGGAGAGGQGGGASGQGGTNSGGADGQGGGGGMADDRPRFHFETDTQSWQDLTFSRCPECPLHAPTRSTAPVFSGGGSLAYPIESGGMPERLVGVAGASIGPLVPGTLVTYHLFIPENHAVAIAQAFIQTRRVGSWVSQTRNRNQLVAGDWNEFQVTVPAAFAGEIPLELGFMFRLGERAWQGTVYIDHIEFDPGP